MRSRDEVLREFPVDLQGIRDSYMEISAYHVERMADRIRELESQQAASEPVAWAGIAGMELDNPAPLPNRHPSAAAVTVTEAMVNAAARRGRDYGFNAYCDNAQEYWAAMESVLTAALTHPTTPTRGRDE